MHQDQAHTVSAPMICCVSRHRLVVCHLTLIDAPWMHSLQGWLFVITGWLFVINTRAVQHLECIWHVAPCGEACVYIRLAV